MAFFLRALSEPLLTNHQWRLRKISIRSLICVWKLIIDYNRISQGIMSYLLNAQSSHESLSVMAKSARSRLSFTNMDSFKSQISNYIHYKVWDEITTVEPLKFRNGEVISWVFYWVCDCLPMLGLNLIRVCKSGHLYRISTKPVPEVLMNWNGIVRRHNRK